MALSFPRDMPDGFASVEFELLRNDFLTPNNAGRVYSVTNGVPLWRAAYAIAPQNEINSETMRAWLTSLRGSGRTFKGRDLRQGQPYVYRNIALNTLTRAGATGLNSEGTASQSVNGDRDVLTLGATGGEDLPAGFIITVGDMIGFKWTAGAKRTVARAMETATADGTGEVTFAIEPPLPTVVPTDATAYLYRPYVLMRLMPETQFGGMGPERYIGGSVVGIQDLT